MRPSTPSVCILFTNVIPLICVFIVVPRIPRRIQPAHCAPSSTFFWLLAVPAIAPFVVQYFRFPLICLYSPTLCLFPNLYNCNRAMVYQPIGVAASRCGCATNDGCGERMDDDMITTSKRNNATQFITSITSTLYRALCQSKSPENTRSASAVQGEQRPLDCKLVKVSVHSPMKSLRPLDYDAGESTATAERSRKWAMGLCGATCSPKGGPTSATQASLCGILQPEIKLRGRRWILDGPDPGATQKTRTWNLEAHAQTVRAEQHTELSRHRFSHANRTVWSWDLLAVGQALNSSRRRPARSRGPATLPLACRYTGRTGSVTGWRRTSLLFQTGAKPTQYCTVPRFQMTSPRRRLLNLADWQQQQSQQQQ